MNLLLLFVCVALQCFSSSSATSLKFLLMAPKSRSTESSAVVPAVDQTLRQINRDFTILPQHHLEYILSEKECNEIEALESFINAASDRSIVAVVGCGCSTATEEVAKIAHFLNISVISYASTSVVLSDRSVYRSFFRTVPSDELLLSAVATIMFNYEWRQVSLFTEQDQQFLNYNDKLKATLKQYFINIKQEEWINPNELSNYTLQETSTPRFTFGNILRPHIFVPIASHRVETYLLCEAYHNGKYYPNYAWILLGHHETDWWREYYMETNCSDTDMMKVLNRSLILIPYPEFYNTIKHYPEYDHYQEYEYDWPWDGAYERSNDSDNDYTEQFQEADLYNVSAYASDAVKALATALHNCFQNQNNIDSCKGTQLEWNITFNGQTGFVRFDLRSGNRDANNVVMQQYQFEDNKLRRKNMGLINSDNPLLSTFENQSLVWPDGIPPDGTPQVLFNDVVDVITVVQYILGGITMGCVLIALGFHIIFRKRKIVKLTSPSLNYYLLVGVTFMALSTISPFSRDNFVIVTTLCTISSCVAAFGYDIVAAVTLIKTWRVYYLFKNRSPDKKIPKNWHLLLAVTAIVSVDAAVGIALSIAAVLIGNDVLLQRTAETLPFFNDRDVREVYFDYVCGNSIYYYIFFFFSLAYKFLLNGIGLVFAMLLHNVKIDVLNDSKETIAAMCLSGVIMLSAAPALFILANSINYLTLTWVLENFFLAMVHLSLTFIPKMIALYKDPHGEKVFKKTKGQVLEVKSEKSAFDSTSSYFSESEVVALQEKITSLESKLSQSARSIIVYKNGPPM